MSSSEAASVAGRADTLLWGAPLDECGSCGGT